MLNLNKSKIRNFITKSLRGISLVETIVAIGISSVTLTTASIFSTRLVIRAQENFMEESAVQLQNIVAEQLRLIEADLQLNKAIRINNPNSPEPFAFSSPSANYSWKGAGGISFCDSDTPINLQMNLPDFTQSQSNSEQPIYLQQITSANILTPGSSDYPDYAGYTLFALQKNQLTGSFATSDNTIYLGIRKTVTSTTISGETLSSISFNIVTAYKVLNQPKFTFSVPLEVKMVKDLVCP